MAKSYLIKDTTFQERLEIVRQWQEDESCENSGIDLTEFYNDYISGRKEIAEINAEYVANQQGYVVDVPEDEKLNCGQGGRRF